MITSTEILIFFFYSDKSILKINAERNFEFNLKKNKLQSEQCMQFIQLVLVKEKISMF